MKVVFLDIDGVLNIGGKLNIGKIEKHLVKRLNRLTSKEDVHVVITSSWGLYYDVEEIINIFKNNGFIGNIKEYLFGDLPRAERIKKWVSEHSCSQFVVIDDRDLGEIDKFVQVNPDVGISHENIDCSLKLLGY